MEVRKIYAVFSCSNAAFKHSFSMMRFLDNFHGFRMIDLNGRCDTNRDGVFEGFREMNRLKKETRR